MALEYQAQKERAAKEAEEELARKAELIKQIRLLEKNISGLNAASRKVDLTETSGAGILGEMSVIEIPISLEKNSENFLIFNAKSHFCVASRTFGYSQSTTCRNGREEASGDTQTQIQTDRDD